jgi:hypothetical protein
LEGERAEVSQPVTDELVAWFNCFGLEAVIPELHGSPSPFACGERVSSTSAMNLSEAKEPE